MTRTWLLLVATLAVAVVGSLIELSHEGAGSLPILVYTHLMVTSTFVLIPFFTGWLVAILRETHAWVSVVLIAFSSWVATMLVLHTQATVGEKVAVLVLIVLSLFAGSLAGENS